MCFFKNVRLNAWKDGTEGRTQSNEIFVGHCAGEIRVDDAGMQTERADAASSVFRGERDCEEHVRCLGGAVSDPFVVCFAFLNSRKGVLVAILLLIVCVPIWHDRCGNSR